MARLLLRGRVMKEGSDLSGINGYSEAYCLLKSMAQLVSLLALRT